MSTTPLSRLPIDAIIIGKRHRRDLGDISGLARDIEQNGLFHPIVVTPGGVLIAGERRIAAYKHLGRTDIEVTVIDLDDIRRGELAENVHRKDFLPSEIEAIRRAVAPAVATPVGRPAKEITETFGNKPRGETTAKVGAFAGISGRTIEKIAAVVAAAEHEPERFGQLVADMDRTRRVDGVYRRLSNMRQADKIRAAPPVLPAGPYPVIVADWPSAYEVQQEDPTQRGILTYPTMSFDQICALPVAQLAADDSAQWFWTINLLLANGTATKIIDAWGFKPITILTWDKVHLGRGDRLRGVTEHAVLATRGAPIVDGSATTTLHREPRQGKNSQKPDGFYALVERICPAPPGGYLELFARKQRPGWVTWGDEVHGGDESGAQ